MKKNIFQIPAGLNYFDMVEAFQKHLVSTSLKTTQGHVTHAAELLGIERTTLVEIRKRLKFEMKPSYRKLYMPSKWFGGGDE